MTTNFGKQGSVQGLAPPPHSPPPPSGRRKAQSGMKLTIVFDVPDEVAATRGSWTIVYDLFRLYQPLRRGDQFAIVSTEVGKPDPRITFVDAWCEDETGAHVA